MVETVRIWKDKDGNKTTETKLSGCYTCQEASASDSQGTTTLALELQALGIDCAVHQTGGFTMCVYIKTGDESYVYANDEGFFVLQGRELRRMGELLLQRIRKSAKPKSKSDSTKHGSGKPAPARTLKGETPSGVLG
jgi:hypothetical protein